MNRGRIISIALVVVALLFIVGLSFSLIQANSKLNLTKGDLYSQFQAATSAAIAEDNSLKRQQILSTAAISTLEADNKDAEATRLSMSSTNIGLINKNTNLNTEFENLQKAANCPSALSSVDFTNNGTVSKALMSYVGDRDGSNLRAAWEVIWSNSRSAIHRIYGKYLWVFIVTFDDEKTGTQDTIYDPSGNCFLYVKP